MKDKIDAIELYNTINRAFYRGEKTGSPFHDFPGLYVLIAVCTGDQCYSDSLQSYITYISFIVHALIGR